MNDTNALDTVFASLATGNIEAALECMSADAHIWHCFDRIAHDRESTAREWTAFVGSFPERAFTHVRTQPTVNGFVRQHVMTVRTASGQRLSWEACVVVVMDGDRIQRLDEYIDRAGSFSSPAGVGTERPG